MLKIEVLVPEGHDGAATVTLRDGFSTLAGGHAAASVAPEVARARGNPACDPLRPSGHPPFGSYVLLKCAPSPSGTEAEYGSHILLFQPQSGPALEAESFGRFALLAYAGPGGQDGRPRRTQGGLRLPDAVTREIVSRFDPNRDVELRILPASRPSWWQFWKQPVGTSALSSDSPRFTSPPLDEPSLIEQLSQGTVRRARRASEASEDDGDRWRDSSPSGSSERQSPFEGRGGEFSGAGASGSWGDGTGAPARNSGVDSSGRIIGAAAVGALGAAVAAEASRAAGESQSESPAPSDSATQTSTAY